jgi:hypothetical protein
MHFYTYTGKDQSLSKKNSQLRIQTTKSGITRVEGICMNPNPVGEWKHFAVRMSTANIFGILYNETAAS